ncbi:MAG TPA: DUF6088 family protein [Sphingomonas sp.]|nr:DUF6088 family protein [Sphingomonas sp.]
MPTLSEEILSRAEALPEGEPIFAKQLLGLGSRYAVDQALSRLTRRGALLRVGRGIYVRPLETRFGKRPPATDRLVEAIAEARGETVASHGAAAANALGLTTQVPMRSVYLTSGPSRTLEVGKLKVELRHAPAWQLTLAREPAGEVIRALAWLGPERSETLVTKLKHVLPRTAIDAVQKVSMRLPSWVAQRASELAA